MQAPACCVPLKKPMVTRLQGPLYEAKPGEGLQLEHARQHPVARRRSGRPKVRVNGEEPQRRREVVPNLARRRLSPVWEQAPFLVGAMREEKPP
jgi:hypothetical protein